MGVFYGGLAHAPLSSLIIVCELAGSYDLLVPLMLAEGIAFVALRKRSLYIYGAEDQYAEGNVSGFVEVLSRQVSDRAEIVVLAGSDHGFTGQEAELGKLMADWMDG